MNNWERLHELFKRILTEEIGEETRISPHEQNGAILFKRHDTGELFAVLVGKTDVFTDGKMELIHRNLLIKNLHLALTMRHFDVNMMTPYLKKGVEMAVTEFKKILDDPEKVKESIKRENSLIHG